MRAPAPGACAEFWKTSVCDFMFFWPVETLAGIAFRDEHCRAGAYWQVNAAVFTRTPEAVL